MSTPYHFISFGELQEFSIDASSQGGTFTLSTEVSLKQMKTGLKVFELDTVAFEIGKQTVDLRGSMRIASVPAALRLTQSPLLKEGWLLAGGTQAGYPVRVGDLIAELGEKFGITVPAPFKSFALAAINFKYATGNETFHFACQGNFTIASTPVAAVVAIDITPKALGQSGVAYEQTFGGTISIGNLQFDLKFDSEPTSNTFIATYSHQDGTATSLKLNTLLRTISADMADEIPDSIAIELKNVKFVYCQGKNLGSKQFAFAIDLGAAIDLTNLPMVGKQLPPTLSLGLDSLQVLYSSDEFSGEQLTRINALLPQHISRFSTAGLQQGLALAGSFNIAGEKKPLLIGSGAPPAANASPSPKTPATTSAAQAKTPATTPAVAATSVKWININKTLGPASFKRVGIEFKNSELRLYLDAGIALGGLSVALNELSVGSSIKQFRPSFSLAGLSIDFDKNGLEIGAAFLRQQAVINGIPTDIYNGTAVIKAEVLSLSAMGSYCYYDGHPSLFIYAYLDQALGGPSFFFVEGLAAGFGYNRELLMPNISQVASFPLVAQVMGGSAPPANVSRAVALQNQLSALSTYIPPSIGQIFFAVGIKFSSFKLIHSFALLAVSFGKRVEIDLLGQSNIVVPLQELDNAVTPLAEIKILLMARLLPDEGFLAVSAQLSSDSYIFSKDCHLTGGAAFYSWFKGEHKGDFVATLGGYHPAFKVPAHYPSVPRLGLNWQVSDKLSIKGDMYFALCAHAFMAGGHLEAAYNDGDFRAWFKAGADFLVTWQPYHYEARIYISIGASYTIHVFGSHTISVDLGADLSIWGPEFSGKVTVHIYVCDITIHFGARDSADLKAISWDEFKVKCLPAANKVLGAAITNGQHDKDELDNAIVNPKELELLLDSAIPAKSIKVNGNKIYDIDDTPNTLTAKFGVSPMNKGNETIESELVITISHNPDKPSGYASLDSANLSNVIITPQLKAVPAALWGTNFKPDLNAKDRMVQVVNGINLHTSEPIELPLGGVAFPQLADIIYDAPAIPLVCRKPSAPLPFSEYNSTFGSLGKKLGIA